jgi:miniconductance mechanosensitive channel
MLVFQDTILSLVASIQINSNNMLKIGDWIVMPSHEVDGYVTEIALHTVKVQNWDKTIVTVPMRKLIEESFINWRGMFESGGRRIKRSLYIDQRSIRFLSDAEIKRLEEFVLLNDYLDEKQKEIAEWNAELSSKGAKPINGRRITNIGTFRIYVEKYLRSNKAINQDMLMLVRQLAPETTGLPLEIYCFTQSTQWVEYEKAQADIFDHLLAILPVFGLRVFQDCSDIYQEISDVPTFTDGVFPENNLVAPLYPSDMKRLKSIAHAIEHEKSAGKE